MSDVVKAGAAEGHGAEVDRITGQMTTGHTWDGIQELDRPLPRWWLWTYYATIVFALGYVIAYPAIPLVTSATKGVLGYSTRVSVEEAMSAARTAQSGNLQKIADLSLADIAKDEDLTRFAIAGGRSAYLVNCVQCHGSGAAGSKGYPNLNDDEWLWGGSLETIHTTLQHGVRYVADEATRVSDMPRFGADQLLDKEQIGQVAEFVLSLSGHDHDAAKAEAGKTIFADNCASCHGDEGQGNREFGAPSLADAISLYGGDRETITAQINRPRQGVMPAWAGRLDPVVIKQLALYVHSLGGGEAEPAAAPQ